MRRGFLELALHTGQAKEENPPETYGEESDDERKSEQLLERCEFGNEMFGDEKGLERTESDEVKTETKRDAGPEERGFARPRLQLEQTDAGANSGGDEEERDGKQQEQGKGKAFVGVLAVRVGLRVEDVEEKTSPDEQSGNATEDGEGRGASDACGTTSGIPNGFRHV